MALLRPPLGKPKPLKEEWDLIGLPSQRLLLPGDLGSSRQPSSSCSVRTMGEALSPSSHPTGALLLFLL